MNRVEISPSLIRWARERFGKDEAVLMERFPKLGDWESRKMLPIHRQLEGFAKATLTPLGAFFLPEPPEDRLPVPDFRTVRDKRAARPSPALLESVYQMQRRQEWNPGDDCTVDLVLALNGLPVATVELKNTGTGQTWRHAEMGTGFIAVRCAPNRFRAAACIGLPDGGG